jgi:hypothetical protein
MNMKALEITIAIPKTFGRKIGELYGRFEMLFTAIALSVLSAASFWYYYINKLGLSYNDARSHLDIGRRIVEGLKPGLAQIGSVWLPLNHLLMVPTIWNDWMWHSGLSGAIQSMIAFVGTGCVISILLKKLHVGALRRFVGVAVFAANVNVLYLQSTAMTEILLLGTMTVGAYELIMWHQDDNILHLVKSAFWIMLSTLVRYDGWFLLLYAALLIFIQVLKKRGYKTAEGAAILFLTLGAVGVFLWFLWNQLIFKDALYFILGPFSAYAQQVQMAKAGALASKHNLLLSIQIFLYSFMFNAYTYPAILGMVAAVVLWCDKKLSARVRLATTVLFVPFLFNVLSLYLGFSVVFVQGISGNTWFNIRYGIMLMPAVAIFIGYLVDREKFLRWVLVLTLALVLFFAVANNDSVTLDDARVGSSQKNVSEVSGFLNTHAINEKGFILISAASHDAIIFSSGLPMKRFIHEGTGLYWENATTMPDQWARWIVMRTYDDNDLTWKAVSRVPGFAKYRKVASYPFADVYELDPQYLGGLTTEPIFGKQK